MNLPYNRLARVLEYDVLVAVPAFGVGRIEVYDHGAVAVNTDSLSVAVLSLVCRAVDRYNIGVVLVLVIAAECVAPDTGGAVLGHRVLADNSRTGFAVGACFVELNLNSTRVRRPSLEGGRTRRIRAAEIGCVVSRACLGLKVILIGICADRVVVNHCVCGDSRRAHYQDGSQQQR